MTKTGEVASTHLVYVRRGGRGSYSSYCAEVAVTGDLDVAQWFCGDGGYDIKDGDEIFVMPFPDAAGVARVDSQVRLEAA